MDEDRRHCPRLCSGRRGPRFKSGQPDSKVLVKASGFRSARALGRIGADQAREYRVFESLPDQLDVIESTAVLSTGP
jgi:hypothetical protein